jgi:outer membrane receptor protein involved in Fe transport
LLRASLAGLCLLTLASRAEAAEARRRFAIPEEPYAEALIDLAVQADVSLLGASACGASGRASLSGVYTLDEALGRLLAGAPCDFRIVDASTIRILPQASAASALRPPPPVTLVAELMVTARKRPERLDSLPAGVSAISGDQLRATEASDVRDTAGQLVGVLMTNLGPGRDKLLMRGLSDGAFTGRARSTVSTYVDDVPVNYNAPDPDLKLTDVERVETVRGPQGALYGSGALAGVYRIVTNKPDSQTFSSGLSAIAAWTEGGSPSREIEGYWNAPLVTDRAAVRLVAYYDDDGGYIDNVSLGLPNVDRTTRSGVRAAIALQVADNWSLDLSALAQRLHSEDTQYTTPAVGRDNRASRVREAHDNDFGEGAVTLEGDLGWAHLHSSTAYIRHTYSSLYDATAATSLFTDVAAAGAAPDLGIYSERARINRTVQDLVLTSNGAGAVSWLVGVYGSSSRERTPDLLGVQVTPGAPVSPQGPIDSATFQPTPGLSTIQISNFPLSAIYQENRRDRLSELAVYGEGTWRFAPGWTASAGARAFKNSVKVNADIFGATPPATSRNILQGSSFSGISPKVSLQYQFASGDMVYGLYSEGFRPGGINSTGFFAIRPTRSTYGADRLQNFELGAKGRFLGKRLILRAAAFYDLWSNIQSDQYRPSGLAYTANVGDAHIAGLEAEAAYEWDFGLTLQANGLLSVPRFTSINHDFSSKLGSSLPGAPKLSGGLLARYDRPLPYGLTLRLTGETSYVGPTHLTFDPTMSAHTDAVFDTTLTAGLAARRWTAGLFVSNPTNASSNTFAYGNPFTFGRVPQVTPQRPRTVGLRLAAAL